MQDGGGGGGGGGGGCGGGVGCGCCWWCHYISILTSLFCLFKILL